MCRVVDLQQAVLAKNDGAAQALRAELTARGTTVVNMLSSPGSGKTALLERELVLGAERGVAVAALTADLATENDAVRLARSGAPVKQVLTDGLCHLEAVMLGRHLHGWLPEETRLLFVENVGNLVCPASYDLGESLRVVLASVTEGEDKPLKYPTAFGLAQLVVVTKTDIARAVEFDEAAFRANVQQVNPGVEVVLTSARTGEGVGLLLDLAQAVGAGAAAHTPVMAGARAQTPSPGAGGGADGVHGHSHGDSHSHGHHHDGHTHGPGDGHDHDHGPGHGHGHGPEHGQAHAHGHGPEHGQAHGQGHTPLPSGPPAAAQAHTR
ncbi:hydrogenase nickel incorporation protein HypB [Streptomyces sp. NBC_01264]|uniref:hydrogenase nickel incorporation protein HypB n=1 Tax=Streptomyces sp. NBC_01264 TaxID=2903804 RepID=UPI0022536CFE|nr:hydrogenase nickel incorporation protein HypB [Streptomyces sp. NBC_01264]MCX4775923.1 hydrogenase nickel incorporation protein HypB [Streptomyces sp. NBC_01264]